MKWKAFEFRKRVWRRLVRNLFTRKISNHLKSSTLHKACSASITLKYTTASTDTVTESRLRILEKEVNHFAKLLRKSVGFFYMSNKMRIMLHGVVAKTTKITIARSDEVLPIFCRSTFDFEWLIFWFHKDLLSTHNFTSCGGTSNETVLRSTHR